MWWEYLKSLCIYLPWYPRLTSGQVESEGKRVIKTPGVNRSVPLSSTCDPMDLNTCYSNCEQGVCVRINIQKMISFTNNIISLIISWFISWRTREESHFVICWNIDKHLFSDGPPDHQALKLFCWNGLETSEPHVIEWSPLRDVMFSYFSPSQRAQKQRINAGCLFETWANNTTHEWRQKSLKYTYTFTQHFHEDVDSSVFVLYPTLAGCVEELVFFKKRSCSSHFSTRCEREKSWWQTLKVFHGMFRVFIDFLKIFSCF